MICTDDEMMDVGMTIKNHFGDKESTPQRSVLSKPSVRKSSIFNLHIFVISTSVISSFKASYVYL